MHQRNFASSDFYKNLLLGVVLGSDYSFKSYDLRRAENDFSHARITCVFYCVAYIRVIWFIQLLFIQSSSKGDNRVPRIVVSLVYGPQAYVLVFRILCPIPRF